MRHLNYLMALVVCLSILNYDLAAQKRKKKSNAENINLDEEQFKNLKWRNIGPFRGGRSVAAVGLPGNPLVYFMGSTGGGLWKTTDAGNTWSNTSDKFFKTGTIGAIGIASSDPNIIYVGMGEHAVRGVMTSHGDGIYKSTDGGDNWENVGLPNARHISDLIVHPVDPDIVYVSVQGKLYGPSQEKGIYKTVDGGQNWQKILFVDSNTGASGLSMDDSNPRILYAAFWDHQRYPWKIRSGGPGSSIHKSKDGGVTWEKLEEGLPKVMGKIGVSVSPANTKVVYAVIEAEGEQGGVYKSIDGGMKWTQTSKDRATIGRAWYYNEIFADPNDVNTVYVMNSPFLKSIDGGRNFQPVMTPHVDHHDLWINPNDSDNMISANDGGATITFNGGQTWSTQNNQPTAQFYRVITDNQFPYRVYGGQQDNTSMSIASRTNGAGVTWQDWFAAAGGESAFLAFDPNDPKTIYGNSIEGFIDKLDVKTQEIKSIQAYPELTLGMMPKNMKYRFNWNNPLVGSPHDTKVYYQGGNVLLKTEDGGNSWQEISKDLTRNDSTKQGPGGGPFTNEAAGGENYNTIMYVVESSHEKGTIWVGSDDGLVHVTKNGGESWQNVTPTGLGESIINCIEVSPHDPGTVYIVAMRYKFEDQRPYVYQSTDYGQTWKKIVTGLPDDVFVRVVREDVKTKGILYAGLENAMFVSVDDGNKWQSFQLNLPKLPITDITSRDNDLVVATSGRGFWILDDLGSIQQSLGQLSNTRLFEPKPTVRFEAAGFAAIPTAFAGQNPPNGMLIDYYLHEDCDSADLKLEVLDGEQIIRTFTNKKPKEGKPFDTPPNPVLGAKKGINRLAWDLRTEGLKGVPGQMIFGDLRGYMLPPGNYTLRLMLNQDTLTQQGTVIADPRLENPDYSAVIAMMHEIDDLVNKIHSGVNKMRNAKGQLNNLLTELKKHEQTDSLVSLGQKLSEKLEEWETNIIQPKQKSFQDVINFESKLTANLMYLRGTVNSHIPEVTQGEKARLQDLKMQWDMNETELNELIQQDVSDFNRLYKEQDLPALLLDPSDN